MDTKLLCNWEQPLIRINDYANNLMQNDHTLAQKIEKIVSKKETKHTSDKKLIADIKRAMKNDTRDFAGVSITPLDIFRNVFDATLNSQIEKSSCVTTEDDADAWKQLDKYFLPTKILDGTFNVERDNYNDITEDGLDGAKQVVKFFKKQHGIRLGSNIKAENYVQLLNAVNYIRSFHIYQYVLKQTNDKIFGSEPVNVRIQMTDSMTLDTQFTNMFLKTMKQITDELSKESVYKYITWYDIKCKE